MTASGSFTFGFRGRFRLGTPIPGTPKKKPRRAGLNVHSHAIANSTKSDFRGTSTNSFHAVDEAFVLCCRVTINIMSEAFLLLNFGCLFNDASDSGIHFIIKTFPTCLPLRPKTLCRSQWFSMCLAKALARLSTDFRIWVLIH